MSPRTHNSKAVWLVSIAAFGIASLVLSAGIVKNASNGADFGSVFSEPAQALDESVDVRWEAGDPLLRQLEPQTIEAVEFAWIRSLGAVSNAGVSGDLTGIDVWFSGPAQDQVTELVATGALTTQPEWESHEITADFYSIDGQILMTHIERGSEEGTETLRVVFILRDGNWRVEHLTRLLS